MTEEGKNINIEEEEYTEVELDAVTLTDQQGEEHDYAIVASFSLEDRDYVALCPITSGDLVDEEHTTFYRYEEEEDDGIVLEDIESPEELKLVMETYEELCSEEEL